MNGERRTSFLGAAANAQGERRRNKREPERDQRRLDRGEEERKQRRRNHKETEQEKPIRK